MMSQRALFAAMLLWTTASMVDEVAAFHTRNHQSHRHPGSGIESSLRMTASKPIRRSRSTRTTNKTPRSILDDGQGHINPDLASTLYEWEQQHRADAKLPKLSVSTRQGLRLVDIIVKDIEREVALQGKGGQLVDTTDLIQEGIIVLMESWRKWNREDQTSSSSSEESQSSTTNKKKNHRTDNDLVNAQFEAYARPYIEDRLWNTVWEQTVKLEPNNKQGASSSAVWQKAQQARFQLKSELRGREPSTAELAARLELPVETLELLAMSRRGTLSMESTVEIITRQQDQPRSFQNQDDWEQREGHLLDTGSHVMKDTLVDDYVDEDTSREGEDEMWLHQMHQVAAPLRELIPDGGPTPDDVALSEMIRHDVGTFLSSTLSKQEEQIVRLCFGLDSGKPLSVQEITAKLQLGGIEEAKELLKGALEKLRSSYTRNYVETYLDDEHDFFGEESV